MNARKVLDSVKTKLNIQTDKELAAAMGVQYGALTSALSRGSIQYEAVINLLLKENVNLNEIFDENGTTVQNNFSSFGISMFGQGIVNQGMKSDFQNQDDLEIINKIVEKISFYREYGGNKLVKNFEADIADIMKIYDERAEKFKEMLE